jgi:hypothetical protein
MPPVRWLKPNTEKPGEPGSEGGCHAYSTRPEGRA